MVRMKDFVWNFFSATGDVDAYLLYKEIAEGAGEETANREAAEEEVDFTL
jgi:hypothetical protein